MRFVRLKFLAPLAASGLLFGAVTYGAAHESPTRVQTQPVDYQEECIGEGCDREEVRELWVSFREECINEGCWAEEAIELSGGARYLQNPYYQETKVWAMVQAFRSKLGVRFDDPVISPGRTGDVWNWIYDQLDGQVIKTPKQEW